VTGVLRGATALLLLSVAAAAAPHYVGYDEVRGVLTALAGIAPAALKGQDTTLAQRWAEWARQHDAETRTRIDAGDQETIVNWLLYGTTFTTKPRVPLEEFGDTTRTTRQLTDAQIADLIGDRANDMVTALAAPGQDERRLFARDLFIRQGYSLASQAERLRLLQRLLTLVTQVAGERARYAKETAASDSSATRASSSPSDRSCSGIAGSRPTRRSVRTSPSNAPWRR